MAQDKVLNFKGRVVYQAFAQDSFGGTSYEYVCVDGEVLSVNGGFFFDPPAEDGVRWAVDPKDHDECERQCEHPKERQGWRHSNQTSDADCRALEYFRVAGNVPSWPIPSDWIE